MKINLQGLVVEVVHQPEFDSMTIQNDKKKSKIKVDAGQIPDILLSTFVRVTVECEPYLFPVPETPENKK